MRTEDLERPICPVCACLHFSLRRWERRGRWLVRWLACRNCGRQVRVQERAADGD
jgi:hypothetical protein